MNLVQFYAEHSGEVLGLIGQHLYLVAISTSVAIAVGLPVGIALTRRPRWRGPVLGLANVVQTIPSLALFGFLIPLPLIGGIGARTAVVALVLYGLLPIVRNTYTGITGVDPAAREAGRGTGMTDRQLLLMVDLPLGLGVILAGEASPGRLDRRLGGTAVDAEDGVWIALWHAPSVSSPLRLTASAARRPLYP